MKIIDENGRLFGKISIIDLLVVAVVVVMAAALYVKNTQLDVGMEKPVSVPHQPITMQVRVNGVRNYMYQAIRVGDELWDRDYPSGDNPLGKITDIQVLSDPGTVLCDMDDGTVEMIEAEDTVNLLLTVEGSGVVGDRTYALNGVYSVGVNSNRNYATMLVQFVGMVADVY